RGRTRTGGSADTKASRPPTALVQATRPDPGRAAELCRGSPLGASPHYSPRMGILDHITLSVSDYAKSKTFYEKALAPLGITPIMEFGLACGFGKDGKPEFWIGQGPASFQKA